jgi:hypothetical protein
LPIFDGIGFWVWTWFSSFFVFKLLNKPFVPASKRHLVANYRPRYNLSLLYFRKNIKSVQFWMSKSYTVSIS